jgi:flagellar motor protein MotB
MEAGRQMAAAEIKRACLARLQKELADLQAQQTDRGIDGTRITAQGMGEAVPVANNSTGEGRQRNRRVEVIIANAT